VSSQAHDDVVRAATLPTIPLNDLKRAFAALEGPLRGAAARVLDSGWYVHGPEHAAFEKEFGEFVGGANCVGVANGTDALELAIRALAPPPGSCVVTVANAGMYASTAIRRAGLTPRYVDIDPDSLLMSVESLNERLDDEVSIVVVTHLYGRLADVGEIRAVCRSRGISLLEDCAQAVGAGGVGRRAGTFGDVAAFSFYPTKNLGALGDGGAVTSKQPDVARRVRELRQYGWGAKYEVAMDGGRNSRLDELQAALLRVRLPFVDAWNEKRREIIAHYVQAAEGTGVRVLAARDVDHAGHLAVALAPDRDGVRAALSAAGVQTDVHYPIPDHHQQPFVSESPVRLPVTEATAQQVFSLPCFPELTSAEVERVCAALASL
jgi:aminotransferase EvaB